MNILYFQSLVAHSIFSTLEKCPLYDDILCNTEHTTTPHPTQHNTIMYVVMYIYIYIHEYMHV